MSQIPLRPTASPVDTFAAPEVRAKPSNANQLAQLAQAMSGFNANLQETSMQLAKDEREKTLKRVQADVFNKRLTNRTAFNEAVARGGISWADSPYAMEFADMLVAREEVGQLMLGIDSELENNKDMRFKSVGEIDSYVKDRVRELSAGRPDASTGAMLAEAERHVGRILDKHESRLRKDREMKTELGFTKEVTRWSNELQSAVADGNIDQAEATQVAAGINTAIANARESGIPDAQAAQWTIGALKSQAITFGNAGVLENLMDKVMIGDSKISDLIPQDDLKGIKDQIEQANANKEMDSYRVDAARRTKALTDIQRVWAPKLADLAAQPGELEAATISLDEVPEEYRFELRQWMDEYARRSNAQEINALQTQYVRTVLEGEPRMNLIQSIAAYAVGGAEGATQALSMEKGIKDVRDSDPKVLMGFMSRVVLGGETIEQIFPDLSASMQSGQLNEYALRDIVSLAGRTKTAPEQEISRTAYALADSLEFDLRAIYQGRRDMLEQVITDNGVSFQLSRNAEMDLARQKSRLLAAFHQDTIAGDYNAALENHKKRIGSLLESSNAEPQLISESRRRVRLEETPKPQLAAEVTFDATTGDLKDKSTGVTVNNLKLFESASDFKERARFFVKQAKIDLKTEDGARILMEQSEPHGAAAASHAWYEITAAREGEDAARGAVKTLNVIDKEDIKLSKLLTTFNNKRAAAAKNGETFFTVSRGMGNTVEYTLDEARDYAEELEYQIKQLQMIRDGVGRREDLRTPEEIQQEVSIRTAPSQPRGWFVGNWFDLHIAGPAAQGAFYSLTNRQFDPQGNYRNSELHPHNASGRPSGKAITNDPFD